MLPITIVLTEGFSDWEIAPLAGAGRAFFGAEIRFTSPSGGPINSAAGLPIANTQVFEAPANGVVVVCGGPAWEGNAAPEIADQLRIAHANGCVIAGICGGTVALARAKLLDHVRHTSNGPGYLQELVPDYAGSESYVDQPSAVRDGNIITAPAPAPASFASEVLAASGLDAAAARQIQDMLAMEHGR
jgi:putative intracellular protease/amidase